MSLSVAELIAALPESAEADDASHAAIEPVAGDSSHVQVASYQDHRVAYRVPLTVHGCDFSFSIPHSAIAPLGRTYRWQVIVFAPGDAMTPATGRGYSGHVDATMTHPDGVGRFEPF